MRRRTFLAVFISAMTTAPVAARAQQKPMPLVGSLSSVSPDKGGNWPSGFRRGLADAGFTEGRDVTIEYRWAGGEYDRLPWLAAELVSKKVTVIFCASFPPTLAAKAATSTIPIVFNVGVDPVATGLVASFAHPGGNLTGIAELISEILPKRLQLLHDLVPNAALIGALVNPSHPAADRERQVLLEAAKFLGLEVLIFTARSASEFDGVFEEMVKKAIGALLVGNDSMFFGESDQLTALAARYRMPTIYWERRFMSSGGLMSYGSNIQSNARKAGEYVGRILKGANPADLPVQQPTEFDLILNQKTAKSLGLTIPPTLLAEATEVIE